MATGASITGNGSDWPKTDVDVSTFVTSTRTRGRNSISSKAARLALIATEPEKFHLPVTSDLRYNWVRAWLAALDHAEMTELVIDAWCMVVPKRVAVAHLGD